MRLIPSPLHYDTRGCLTDLETHLLNIAVENMVAHWQQRSRYGSPIERDLGPSQTQVWSDLAEKLDTLEANKDDARWIYERTQQ